MVPVTGLEPVQCCHRGILSPLCLPFHHTGLNFFILSSIPMCVKGKLLCGNAIDSLFPSGYNNLRQQKSIQQNAKETIQCATFKHAFLHCCLRR